MAIRQKKYIEMCNGILLWLMLGKCAEWAPFTVKPYRQSIEMVFLCTRYTHTQHSYNGAWWWRRYPVVRWVCAATATRYYISIDLYLCKMHWSAKTRFQELRTKNQWGKKNSNRPGKKTVRSPEKLMLCNFQHVKPQSDMNALGFMAKVDAKLSIFDLFIEVVFVSFAIFAPFASKVECAEIKFYPQTIFRLTLNAFGECNRTKKKRERKKQNSRVEYLLSFDIQLLWFLWDFRERLRCIFAPFACVRFLFEFERKSLSILHQETFNAMTNCVYRKCK